MANEVVKYHNDLNSVPFRRVNSRELDLFFAICAKMKGKENKEVIFSFSELNEYCEQIEPPVRMIEPASEINRATQCNRDSH